MKLRPNFVWFFLFCFAARTSRILTTNRRMPPPSQRVVVASRTNTQKQLFAVFYSISWSEEVRASRRNSFAGVADAADNVDGSGAMIKQQTHSGDNAIEIDRRLTTHPKTDTNVYR